MSNSSCVILLMSKPGFLATKYLIQSSASSKVPAMQVPFAEHVVGRIAPSVTDPVTEAPLLMPYQREELSTRFGPEYCAEGCQHLQKFINSCKSRGMVVD